jgi:hypothetical protein
VQSGCASMSWRHAAEITWYSRRTGTRAFVCMNVFRLAVASMYDLYRRYDLYRGIQYSVVNATLNVISLRDEILVVEVPRVLNSLQVQKWFDIRLE